MRPGTKELIEVLEGTLTVQVADQVVTLEVGDAVAFSGDLSHSYANHGAYVARFSLAVFEPGVGSGADAAMGWGAGATQQAGVDDA